MKILIITRAIPNTGKTTFCNAICGEENTVSADNFFEEMAKKSGLTYSDVFSKELLGKAHQKCIESCEKLMFDGVEKIGVANTNINVKDMKPYENLARKYGYTVFYCVLENRHNSGDNGHNVPKDVVDGMEIKLRSSLKFK